MKLTKLMMIACILSVLAACGGKEPPRPVVVTPPGMLLGECPAPPMPQGLLAPKNVREYATAATRWALDLEEKLAMCNAQIRAINEWCDAVRGGESHD